jgi:hypothetical protein
MSTRRIDASTVKAQFLHAALDVLVARYLTETGKYVGKSTILDLMYWSHQQAEIEKANAKKKAN